MSHREPLTPEQRRVRARIAANTRWSREPDRLGATERMRRGLQAKFEKLVDPQGVLDPQRRAVLAENARKAHMGRMALASAKSRAKRRDGAA